MGLNRGRWRAQKTEHLQILTAVLHHLKTRSRVLLPRVAEPEIVSGRIWARRLLPGFPPPALHTWRTHGSGWACLSHTRRLLWPGTAHSAPPVPLGSGHPLLPPAASGGSIGLQPRNHHGLHVTSFFPYKLSTCHPAVCFSLLRFSSNYVDFLHPTPSWKLIRLNIFIYYHFAQLLPAFPITLPASL